MNLYSTIAPRRVARSLALLIVVLVAPLLPHQNLFAQQRTVYLPIVSHTVRLASAYISGCSGLKAEEIEMAAEFVTAPGQRRPVTNCNATLSAVARARAQDMANRGYFGHVNPDGIGPDYLIERAGYNLPEFYGVTRSSNHVESIAAGGIYPTANAAWSALLTSPAHRQHLLATEDFFSKQTEFGVGYVYVENTRYQHYWVFISAHPAE